MGAIKKNTWDTFKVALISAVYVVQNNLLFFAAANLDVGTFQVSYQLKILTGAIFFVIILNTKLVLTQWMAILTLLGGVILVKMADLQTGGPGAKALSVTKGAKDDQTSVYMESPMLGFLAIALACCCSGFAGAYFEKVLKKSSSFAGSNSLWLRNVQLSILSIPLAMGLSYGYDSEDISDHGFFVGYDNFVWFMVMVKASGGLIVGMAIKYANNVLKDLATSLAMVIGCLANVFIFGIPLNAQFVIGTVIVIFSLFLYGYRSNKQHESHKPIAVVLNKESTLKITSHGCS